MPPAPCNPAHPERVCWGCTRYCPADDLGCGNGSIRAPHPAELFGPDWREWIEQKADHSRRAAADAVSADP